MAKAKTMKKRIGNQSPSRSWILPYHNSLGSVAIERYEKSGRTAYDWQRNVIDPMLARNGDGLWTHMQFGFSVPRQNGKNEIIAIRELEGIMDLGEKILHTAHRTTTSAAAYNRLLSIIEESGYVEKEDYRKIKAIGRERIEWDGGGSIEFRTRSSLGGLGESFDLLVIDEAQEYTDDQESALKYTIAASPNPQTVFLGTPPTPLSSGTVFVNFRNKALAGKTEDSGWVEWGVEDKTDINEIDTWYKTNPSLGLRLTERTIRAEISNDETDFLIQRLGLWLKYNQKSAISELEWSELKVKSLPSLRGPLSVGIKYGNDGANVALSVAVRTLSGKIFVEVVDCQSVRNGNSWIISFLQRAKPKKIVVDGAAGLMLDKEIKDRRVRGVVLTLPTVKEVVLANALWEQGVYQREIMHANQPSLTQVVTNCDKRAIGTNGGFGYKSLFEDMDICLMDSALLAHWACSITKEVRKQKISY